MNPPFKLAEAFVRKALAEVKPGGEVWALLRLAFLESKERYPFWQEHHADALHVFSKRPSFTDNGRSDQTAYVWIGWNIDGASAGVHIIAPPNLPRRKRATRVEA